MAQYPTFLIGLQQGQREGDWAFGLSTREQTSYEKRERSEDYYGTTQSLWGIAAAVYLSLMGPQGMRDLGEGMMQRSLYAAKKLSQVRGVAAPALSSPFLKELVVNFDGVGKTVSEINKALLERGIFAGKDLSQEFPALGNSALYCVTEVHSKDDIDTLTHALKEVLE